MEAVVDVKYRPAGLFSNAGASASKKLRQEWGAVIEPARVYRECLKNHAASIGGHALDGCGEFMPEPAADPAVPASLRCAACGCHRNFHRRLLAEEPPSAVAVPHVLRDDWPSRGERTPEVRMPGAGMDRSDQSDEVLDNDEDRPMSPLPAPEVELAGYHASAPNMLLSVSTGGPGSGSAPAVVASRPPALAPLPLQGTVPGASLASARKRFRTKFSLEQKQRMRALSERLGWRLQKHDEAVVEDCCREIGVTRGVFKVWMHNNKNNFLGGHSARRSASVSAPAGTAAVHPYSHAAPAPPPASPLPRPPVHTDFNIDGATADFFRVQPVTATVSGGSPQSSSQD